MFETLEINKKEKTVEIKVKLRKKTLPKQPIVKFSWKEAKVLVEQRYPELEIGRPIDLKLVLNNKDKNLLEDTWVFPIVQKEEPAKQEIEPKVNKKNENKTAHQSNKTKLPLTKRLKPATVEKTEQDNRPAIVQEPTE